MGDEKTPVERAIAAFGSVESLATAISQSVHRVYRWRREKENGGRDGRIPDDAQPLILRAARERGIALTAEDLIDMRDPSHVRTREDCQ
jgi:hypothetical protein